MKDHLSGHLPSRPWVNAMSTRIDPVEAARERLAQRARQLEQLLANERPRRETEHEVTDQKDGAAEEAQAEVDSAATQRHLAELRLIERARERLAAGTYGECVDCGESISPARLLAQPTAMRCMACQRNAEHRGQH
ncbi:MAG TPA: TraR/DksA family transcriptional regulator [Ideonella sp.]|uniref:TraR/DksA family transcriptional regulator n=1 Tax=Ideonella sp. TaxID=1929293 RepID=UPI002E37FBA5|nr:TraR/DksA family transcriptional regulator [Ideonella sp.]HEX5685738.1 TraR/DksA family transcriptional regulator [Ideonella sp.]